MNVNIDKGVITIRCGSTESEELIYRFLTERVQRIELAQNTLHFEESQLLDAALKMEKKASKLNLTPSVAPIIIPETPEDIELEKLQPLNESTDEPLISEAEKEENNKADAEQQLKMYDNMEM